MKYESSIKKNLQIFENEIQNTIDSDNLNELNLVRRDENYRKTVGVISLLRGFNTQTGTTNSTGFVNPFLKITNFSPNITPPPRIFPVVLDFVPIGESVTIPDALLNKNNDLLLVANTGSETPVPDTEEDLDAVNITVTPSDTNIPSPLTGTPIFIAPGVMSIPLSNIETTVGGSNPNINVNIGNGVNFQTIQLNLNSEITVSPSIALDTPNNGNSPINNPASVSTVADSGGILGSVNTAPVPNFNFTNTPQITNTFAPPAIVISPIGE